MLKNIHAVFLVLTIFVFFVTCQTCFSNTVVLEVSQTDLHIFNTSKGKLRPSLTDAFFRTASRTVCTCLCPGLQTFTRILRKLILSLVLQRWQQNNNSISVALALKRTDTGKNINQISPCRQPNNPYLQRSLSQGCS